MWNIITGLYQAAHECGHSQVPVPKIQKKKCAQGQQLLWSIQPPKDKYLDGTQPRQMMVIEDNSSLLAPLAANKPECKEILTIMQRAETILQAR